MTASELMLQAVTDGLGDDATTAAALDAIREESGCSLLAAVLEVARVHAAAHDARTITEASTYLDNSSPVRSELRASIYAECINLPSSAYTTIVVTAGSRSPVATVNYEESYPDFIQMAAITVGALWVKRETSRLLVLRERGKRKGRTRPKH